MAPLEMISMTLFLLTTTRAGSNSQLSAGTAAVEFGSATDRAPGDRQPICTSDGAEPGSVPHESGDDPSDLAPEYLRVPQLRPLQTRSTTGPGAAANGSSSCKYAVRSREPLLGTSQQAETAPKLPTLATNRTSNSSAPPGECAEVSNLSPKRCVYVCKIL